MTWECAECGDREKADLKIPVCHHCGKTVCRKHREMIADDAFSAGLLQTGTRVAVHCLDCKKEFHKSAVNVEAGAVAVRKAGTP